MRKLFAALFLLVLALPYARAPLCQLGSHEHEEESHVAMGAMSAMEGDRVGHDHGQGQHRHAAHDATSADAHGPAVAPLGDTDCHDLMRCQVAASLEAISSSAGETMRIDIALEEPSPARSLLGQHPAPELPPPRSV